MSCSPRPLVVACLLSLLVLCSSAPTQEASKAADAAAPPADANVEVLDHETKVELVDHLTLPHAPHRPVAAIVVPKQQPGADSRFMAVRSEQTVQPPANNGAPLLNSLVAHSSMSQLAQTADAKYTAAMAQESIQREAEDRLDMVRRERQLTHDLATNRLHDARAQTMEERRRLAAEERRERLKLMRDERELSLLKEEQAKRETSARQALSDLRGMNRAEHIVRAHDRFSQEEQNFQRRFKVQESVSEKQYEEKRDMARKNRWAMRMRRLAQMNEEQLRLMSAKRANFIRSAMKNATAIQTAQYLAQAAVKDEADIASKLLTVSQVLGELIRDRNDVREELHTAERERAHIVEILSALNADLQSKERIHSMAKSDLQRAHAEISEAQFRAESEETGTQAKVSAAMDIMIAIKAARPIQQSVLQTEKTVIEAKERIGNTRRDLALADDQIDELKPKVARYTAEVRRAKEVLQQLQSKFEWAKMREQQAEAAVRLVAGDAASGMQREFLDTMIKSRNKVRQQIEHQRRKLARQNLIQAKRWEHLRRASRNMQATRVDALKKQLLTAEHDTAISRNEALTLSSKIKHDAKATLNRDLAMRSGSADKLRAEEQTKLQEADVEMKRLKSEMAKKHEANEKEVDSYKKQAAEIKRAQRDREQREKAKEKELEEEENMEMAERKKELTVLKESHEKLLDSLKNKHTKQMMEEKEHEEKELFRLQYGPTPGSQEWLDQLKKQQEAKLKDVTKKLQHEKDQVADAKQKALDEEAEALLRKEAELTGDHDKLVDFMKKKSADYEIEARQAAAKLQDDEKVQGRRDKANVDVVNKIEQAAIKNHVNVIRSLDKAIDEAKKDKDTTEFKVFLKHTKDLVQQMAERDVMSEQQHRRLVKLLKQYHREHMRNMALRDHEDRRFKQQNDDEQDVWKEDHDAKEELLGYLKHLFKIHDNEWKDRNWQANNFLVKSRAREWFSNHAVQRMNRHHRFVKNIQGKYMKWVSELPCGVGMKNCLQKQPEPADETVPSYRPVENDAAEKKVDNVLNEAQDALSHAEDDAARFRETRSDSTLSSSAEPALLQSNEVKADSSLSSASSELDALSGADTEIQQWMSNVLQTGADGVAAL